MVTLKQLPNKSHRDDPVVMVTHIVTTLNHITMSNTYTQLNIHAVFAVKGRENYCSPKSGKIFLGT